MKNPMFYEVIHTNGSTSMVPNEEGHQVGDEKCICSPQVTLGEKGKKIQHNVMNN